MNLTEAKDTPRKRLLPALVALMLSILLAGTGIVYSYLSAHDSVTNRFSFADEDKDVTVEWREVPPTIDIDHDGTFLIVRIAWNNTTATYVEGDTTTTLNAYSVGNEGSYDAPDPYIFLADTQTEEFYQALLIGAEVTVTNSATPIPTGKLFYIEKDRGSTEHPTKNGVTYSKYRMTVKPYTTTIIKQSQLKKLLSVQPVNPQWSGYVHNGWTTPVKVGIDPDTGNDKYVVKSTWVKRSNTEVDENSSYAAVYGDDTLVFGRGLAPGSYEGKSLSELNGVACTWYDIEDEVYSRVELPWREVKPNIKSVVVKDTIAPKSIAFWFETMANLTSVDLSKLDATQIEDAQSLFGNDTKLSTIDLSMLEMPKVKNISNMFYGCTAATSIKIPCGFTSELKELGQVFYDCLSIQTLDLETLDVSGATNMSRIFWNMASVQTIYVNENWSVQHIRDGIAEGKYDNHGQMFSGCNNLIGGNGTKCETGHLGAETDAASINFANIDQINEVGYLTCRTGMTGSVSITSPDGKEDAVPGAELQTTTCNLPSGSTLTYQWHRDSEPIEGATSPTYVVVEQDDGKEITCEVTVNGNYSLVSNTLYGGYPAFAIYSTDDKSFCFYKRAYMPQLGEVFEGKEVTRIYTDFEHNPFGGYFLQKWGGIARNVVDCRVVDKGIRPKSTSRWFQNFTSCTGFTLYNLDTSHVTDMSYMFYGCTSLTAYDIAFLDVSKVETAYAMFASCESLRYLYSTSTTAWNIPITGLMFENCTVIEGSNGTVYDPENITGTFARADGLEGKPGYFTVAYTTTLDGTVEISGAAKQGETLSATVSAAPAGAELSYQWYRDEDPIEGATSPTYTLTEEDVSHSIRCVVSAANCTGSIASENIGPISANKTEIDKQLESMTLHEKVCQMFTVYPEDLGGSGALTVAGSTQQKTLQAYPYGGVCYFLQNIKNEDQARALVSTLESYSKIPLLHSVDEEGGRVQRIGGTTYSGAVRGAGIGNQLNAMYTYKDLGTDTSYNNAQMLAANLIRLGMNWDFAPVADVNSNPANPIIGDRAYGNDFDATGELVASAVRGFSDAGVATSLKHFPGHGDTATDSHTGAASVSKTLDQLRNEEFKSFKAGIAAGADSVMMGHLMIEGAKESVPTSCSYEFVTEVLRNELGFEGVITTDGMGMGAITKVYGTDKQGHIDAVMACLNAGVDVFLLPGDPAACVDAIEAAVERGEVSEERIDASVKRILTLKEKLASSASKRNAAALQYMHAAAVADEALGVSLAPDERQVDLEITLDQKNVSLGDSVALQATAQGADLEGIRYQWYVARSLDMSDKTAIEGASSSTLEYSPTEAGELFFQCELIVSDTSYLSNVLSLSVTSPQGAE